MTRRQSSKVLAVQPCFPSDVAIAKRELGARTYKRMLTINAQAIELGGVIKVRF